MWLVFGCNFCMGPFTWPYDEMLAESSTDLDDDSSCSIWPFTMSEDLIVSICNGLVEPQSLNISGPSIYPVKEPSRKHCFWHHVFVCPCCVIYSFILYNIDAQHCPFLWLLMKNKNDVRYCEFLYHSFLKGLPSFPSPWGDGVHRIEHTFFLTQSFPLIHCWLIKSD